jgi:hypothetical protein
MVLRAGSVLAVLFLLVLAADAVVAAPVTVLLAVEGMT